MEHKYDRSYKNLDGWTACLGPDDYHHRFGGSSWTVEGNRLQEDAPAILLNLDLTDPRLKDLDRANIGELPLCSYLNCGIWEQEQIYQLHPGEKKISLVQPFNDPVDYAEREDYIRVPMGEKRITLVKMGDGDIPVDEDSYWRACDSFLGGDHPIRILGAPLWLQEAESPECICHKKMKYIASIGYENFNEPAGFLDQDNPLFLGEIAIYFFFCMDCSIIKVIGQDS